MFEEASFTPGMIPFQNILHMTKRHVSLDTGIGVFCTYYGFNDDKLNHIF